MKIEMEIIEGDSIASMFFSFGDKYEFVFELGSSSGIVDRWLQDRMEIVDGNIGYNWLVSE